MKHRGPDLEHDDFDGRDFEDEDASLGEPVTDKLQVLLDALPDDAWDEAEGDLGEPVTEKLQALLGELPGGGALVDDDVDLGEPVTDKLSVLLAELPGESVWARARRRAERRRLAGDVAANSPRGMALLAAEFLKALFHPLFGSKKTRDR